MHTPNLAMMTAILFTLGVGATAANAQTVIHIDDDAPLGGDGTTWATASRYLQDGLAVASGGDEIHVAGGTYTPDQDEAGNVTVGDREATFQLVSGVALRGGYRGCPGGNCSNGDPDERNITLYEAILSGDLDRDDPPLVSDCCSAHAEPGCDATVCEVTVCAAYPECCSDPWNAACATYAGSLCTSVCTYNENGHHVVTGSGTDNTAVLDGFTITAGNANGPDPHDDGAGMYNSGGSPMLADCTFRVNTATDVGGGLYNSGGSPTLTNCTFTDNAATGDGGGMYTSGGTPTLTDCTFTDNATTDNGGGMWNYDSDLTLTNCAFMGNSAGGKGGAMFNHKCNLTLDYCTFSGNHGGSGGGMYNESTSPTVTTSTFSGNSAHSGGGMYNAITSPTLTDCTFMGNTAGSYGGGMYSTNNSSPALTDCTFDGNSAGDSGGGMYDINSAMLMNCTFSGNSAGGRGGGMLDAHASTLTNCTFSENVASDGGGMYTLTAGSPTVVNSILWGNTDDGGMDETAQIHGGPVIIDYSCVQGWLGGLGGTGNHGDDPGFIDANGDDDVPGTEDDNLRLTSGSPCIDAADNDAVIDCALVCLSDGDCADPVFDTCYTDIGCCGVGTDLDGNARIVDGDSDETPTVDMGAYEYQGTCQTDPDCDDDDLCTDDTCDLRFGICLNAPIACDAGEICIEGECVDLCAEVDCDDHYSCTEDSCDPETGTCTNALIECPAGEMCIAGQCEPEVCEFMDTDGDADIDLADFAVFQNCMSGPG